jgi:uncharacterized protein (TIGR02246 family)
MVRRFAIRVGCIFGVCLALFSSRELSAQAVNHAKDEAAIRQASSDYLAAIAKGDTKALADFWTADGTCTDETGHTVKVREQLAKSGERQSDGGARAKPTDTKIRFIANDVAVEEGSIESPPVEGGPAVKGRYSAMWLREGDRWKLDNVQETHTEAVNADQVAALNVFVGEWKGEKNGITVNISAKWDANKKFLQRKVTMTASKSSIVGTQQIGWDPLSQQIRSWMFSDDGSLSEGVWSREGYFWMVLASRVLPDGQISKSTQIYKFPDKNTLVWKSVACSIDGESTDDFEIVLKRTATK